jgi:hypothetical protein
MLSWRGGLTNSIGRDASFIVILLDDVRFVWEASPESLFCEKPVELYECRNTHPWRTQIHCPANHRVEHPCRNYNDVTGRRLNTDDGLAGTALTVITPDRSAVERVPTIMDLHF